MTVTCQEVEMRTMFVTYLSLIALGLVFFLITALRHL